MLLLVFSCRGYLYGCKHYPYNKIELLVTIRAVFGYHTLGVSIIIIHMFSHFVDLLFELMCALLRTVIVI